MSDRTIVWFQRFAIVIAIVLGVFVWQTKYGDFSFIDTFLPPSPVMRIGSAPIRVEFAVTEGERVQGLSGREALGESEGLLFVFPESAYHAMWMKDMRFPIDIIWISAEGKVISIDQDVSPESYPRKFRPARPAKYVLETNAKYVETFGVQIGDEVQIPAEYIEK